MQNIDKPYPPGHAGCAAPAGKSPSTRVFGHNERQVSGEPDSGTHEITDGTQVIAVEIGPGRRPVGQCSRQHLRSNHHAGLLQILYWRENSTQAVVVLVGVLGQGKGRFDDHGITDAFATTEDGRTTLDVTSLLSSDERFASGMYKAEKSRWVIDEPYGVDEFMYFLKGGVTLTSSDGSVTVIKAGEAVTIPKEWTGIWDTDGYEKIWVIYSADGSGL